MAPDEILGDDDLSPFKSHKDVLTMPRTVGSMAWDGHSLRISQYTYELASDDIEEIQEALEVFKGLQLTIAKPRLDSELMKGL